MAAPTGLIYFLCTDAVWAEPFVVLPKYRIEANELGVIVNRNNPLSVQIADYYRAARFFAAMAANCICFVAVT